MRFSIFFFWYIFTQVETCRSSFAETQIILETIANTKTVIQRKRFFFHNYCQWQIYPCTVLDFIYRGGLQRELNSLSFFFYEISSPETPLCQSLWWEQKALGRGREENSKIDRGIATFMTPWWKSGWSHFRSWGCSGDTKNERKLFPTNVRPVAAAKSCPHMARKLWYLNSKLQWKNSLFLYPDVIKAQEHFGKYPFGLH